MNLLARPGDASMHLLPIFCSVHPGDDARLDAWHHGSSASCMAERTYLVCHNRPIHHFRGHMGLDPSYLNHELLYQDANIKFFTKMLYRHAESCRWSCWTRAQAGRRGRGMRWTRRRRRASSRTTSPRTCRARAAICRACASPLAAICRSCSGK